MNSMWHSTLERVEQQLQAMGQELAGSDAQALQASAQWLQRISQALVQWALSDEGRQQAPDAEVARRLQRILARLAPLRQALAQRQAQVDNALGVLVPSARQQRGPTYAPQLSAAGARRSPYQSSTTPSGTWTTARV
ncbi:MAG: hypothetical protein ACT4NV_10395 [Rhodoferax sp.]